MMVVYVQRATTMRSLAGPIRSEAQNGIRSEGQKRLQRPPVGGGDAQHSASPGEAEQQFEQHRGFGRW
jgi:hypothetical protein